MDLALAIQEIWYRKLWLIPVIVLAALAALMVAFRVSFIPPALEDKSFEFGAANAELLVDSDPSSLAELEVPVAALSERAQIYARLLKSDTVRREIGTEIGVPFTSIFVDDAAPDEADAAGQPAAPERAVELLGDESARRISFSSEGPVITLDTQAPSAEQAIELAEASSTALQEYVSDQVAELDSGRHITIASLGRATGGAINQSADMVVAGAAAFGVFVLGCLAILWIPRFSDAFHTLGSVDAEPWPDVDVSAANSTNGDGHLRRDEVVSTSSQASASAPED